IVDISRKQPAGLAQLVRLTNPLSSDMDALRPSLLVGLLDAVGHNHSQRNPDVALFEIGRRFEWSGTLPREEVTVAIAISGSRSTPFWQGAERDAQVDFYDLKGIIQEFLASLGLQAVTFTKREPVPEHFLGESAEISIGGKIRIGEMGQLNRLLQDQFQIKAPVFVAELDLNQILARRTTTKSFKPLPQFPSIRRDLALLVNETVTHDAVLNVVRQARPANLESTELFDVFRGKNVPAGQKSVAYAFIYRHAGRTLTDQEVNAAHEDLVRRLREQLDAVVR
ncbi:MAG TPA: phenylalanine--tRNA ligase subunit beta, partial [Candidatus Nitrosotalea sp.]|nr:phenylalanine--tRNA ligase subunit beta [Candidatus Nitrosotalea sp.]